MNRASKYSQQWDIDQNELMNQGISIFYKSAQSYNPELSSFNTWLYMNLQWGLSLYCMNNTFDFAQWVDSECFTNSFKQRQTRQIAFRDMMINLSPDSRIVVDIVLDQDHLPINMKKGNRLTQGILRRYLLKVKQWKHKRIDIVFNEIKEALRGL
jgi:hypothetical protein